MPPLQGANCTATIDQGRALVGALNMNPPQPEVTLSIIQSIIASRGAAFCAGALATAGVIYAYQMVNTRNDPWKGRMDMQAQCLEDIGKRIDRLQENIEFLTKGDVDDIARIALESSFLNPQELGMTLRECWSAYDHARSELETHIASGGWFFPSSLRKSICELDGDIGRISRSTTESSAVISKAVKALVDKLKECGTSIVVSGESTATQRWHQQEARHLLSP